MKAVHLRCEYLKTPLGLDIPSPRFYWHCEGGQLQSAYRIVCERDGKPVWDSGKVLSSSMAHIRYEGAPLESRDRVVWSVTLWDENGVPGETASSWFEMGLLHAEDWQAQWISGNIRPKKNVRYPVDCFKRPFTVTGPVAKARLYITACGLYEAKLNGTKAGSCELAPGSTDYRKRIQYQALDVTDLIHPGENVLTAELADGWYRGSVGAFGLRNAYGKETKLLYQLEITGEDGRVQTIASDAQTRWSDDGPIRFADLKDGEVVDASCSPSYAGSAKRSICRILPTSSNNVIPEMHERFPGKRLTTPSGKTVYDFGQNLAGFVEFKVHGKKGEKVTLLLGEMLDEKGEFTQDNFQLTVPADDIGKLQEMMVVSGKSDKVSKNLKKTPEQKIVFYCSGGEDFYRTKFAVFGFRYALVETGAQICDLTSVAVYSSMERTGTFSSSDEKVNRLYQNTLWSMKSNFLDVPTDCPTRERLGWTGDAQVFFNTGAYLMNTAPFYRKFLYDLMDAQTGEGKVPAVVPYSRADVMYNVTGNSVGWADAMVLIPYRYWKCYGDTDLLKTFWPMMRKYGMYLIGHTGHKNAAEAKADPYNKYVYEKGFHLGEWLEPEEFEEKMTSDKGNSAVTASRTEECTAYLHYSMTCLEEIAEELGYTDDASVFAEYRDGSAKAYAHLFLDPVPDTDREAKLVRPLAFGLVPEDKKKAVEDRLAEAAVHRNYRVATGFLSTPFVLPVLTAAGYADTAYRMLLCEDSPSWLYEVDQGATTIWESWEGDASRNHYSPGSVCEWLFSSVLGIRMAGENHFRIAPVTGTLLDHAEGSYESIYGKVESAWEKRGEEYLYRIRIPSGTTADVILPGKTLLLGAGEYNFTVPAAGGQREAV